MGFLRAQRACLPVAFFIALSGCSPYGSKTNRVARTQATESAYCSQNFSYPSGPTITGKAVFQFRTLDYDQGLMGVDPTTPPIPFAEIRVLSATGSTVQCGTTNADGDLKSLSLGDLKVPRTGTYTVQVFSRSETGKLKITVNGDYYENRPYVISKNVSVGGASASAGTLTAAAKTAVSAALEGGAFNIYYQIYRANQFLRDALADQTFVAPKVKVYWKKGFNPYTYFGYSSMLSFYRSGEHELFILGGTNGLVHNVDTDHFDNSVILHEYGHFLEDALSISDSPGGSHDGNSIIDPRLAWSEGWGNFFQAAVLKNMGSQLDPNWKYYIDTKGYRDPSEGVSSGSLLVKVDFSKSGLVAGCADSPSPFDGATCDRVSADGEGTYREMSIARYLFKSLDATASNISFDKIWKAFSSRNIASVPRGFASPNVIFRNIGRFNEMLDYWINLDSSTDLTEWQNLRNDEKQSTSSLYYANSLSKIPATTCPLIQIQGVADDSYDGTSNQFHSNHFYRFHHDGGNKSIVLHYENGANVPFEAFRDLDLYLYKQDYVYHEQGEANDGSIAKSSARRFGGSGESGAGGGIGREEISLNGLTAGHYLINVKVYTKDIVQARLGTLDYRLQQVTNGTTEDLCPDP